MYNTKRVIMEQIEKLVAEHGKLRIVPIFGQYVVPGDPSIYGSQERWQLRAGKDGPSIATADTLHELVAVCYGRFYCV